MGLGLRWIDYGVIVAAVAVRLLVGLSGYSGEGTPPKFGDYEAQRHWMEITTNMIPTTWYVESEHNSFSYWPLDYPPFSGYQSWLTGQVLDAFEPESVKLGSSRGYESPSSKLLMRITVLVSDIYIYFPAVIMCTVVFGKGLAPYHRTLMLIALLMQPALILIDHGHFQFNCIGLGFTALAAALAAQGKDILGVVKLGVTVIATFAVIWAPCMRSPKDVLLILNRIFPIRRGLYEDYVANFWCATSVLVKWRELVPQDMLLKACAGTTLVVALPAMLQQMRAPSPRGLLLCMANSSLAFFMFSFQSGGPRAPGDSAPGSAPSTEPPPPEAVKGAPLPPLGRPPPGPLLPAPTRTPPMAPEMCSPDPSPTHSLAGAMKKWAVEHHLLLGSVGVVAMCAMHFAREFVEPPERLPWLHDRICITVSFVYLAVTMVYLQVRQWTKPMSRDGRRGLGDKDKLQKERLMARRGHQMALPYTDVLDSLVQPSKQSPAYIDEASRFSGTAVSEEAARRKAQFEKKENKFEQRKSNSIESKINGPV
eukprot:gene3984-14062_t